MEQQFTIFFSWQSDVKPNRNVIKKGLKSSCAALSRNFGYTFKYDESTRGKPGSPKIEDSVLDKIDNCDIFVADITPKQMGNDK